MKIGVACANITPTRPVWMAGFATRSRPSEGVYQDLFAKVLALHDERNRAALISTDLLFFDDLLQTRIEQRLGDALGLESHEIILTASHTHSGPAINEREWPLYPNFDREYVAELVGRVAQAAERAFADLREAAVTFGVGACHIGVNRRRSTLEGIVMQPNPEGPTDPEVAVLGAGEAVVMSYACHPSTWDSYLLGGDYPGFAQQFIEQRHPGVHAMFLQGCSGDIKVRNLAPDGRFQSGPLENVACLGGEFSEAVSEVLRGPMRSVEGPLDVRRADFELPLSDPPTREEAAAARQDTNPWRAAWGDRMLASLERGEALPRSCAAMVQVLTIGDFALIALSGEVGVEIGLRIKRMFPGRLVLVAAYAGPSVLTDYVMPKHRFPEGGYEVNGNYFYTLLPAPLRPEAEDIIVQNVQGLVGR